MKENTLNGLPLEKLPREQEDNLARVGTEDARTQLVMHNMREGFYYAHRCCRGKLPEDEVVSAVYKALSHAARNYKPRKVRFFAYAKPYIRGLLCKEFKFRHVVKNAMHDSLEVVREIPVERWVDSDGISEQPSPMWEAHKHVEPEWNQIALNERLDVVRPIMKKHLSELQRMIIELVYLGHFSFEDVAKQLGISRSAVQNTHKRALIKIRSVLERKQELLTGDAR